MLAQVVHGVVLGILAVALATLGHWGRSRATVLVPAHLPPADRDRKAGSIRRGSWACYVAAVVLAAAAVLAVV